MPKDPEKSVVYSTELQAIETLSLFLSFSFFLLFAIAHRSYYSSHVEYY